MSDFTWSIIESRMIGDAWYKKKQKQKPTRSKNWLRLEGMLVQAEDGIPTGTGKVVGKKQLCQSHKIVKWSLLLWNMKLHPLKHEINISNV
jgi:hypothetical protein